jgi:tetratricopeptide (TPR) repeat protein
VRCSGGVATLVEPPEPDVRSRTTLLGDESSSAVRRPPAPELATGDIVGRYVVLSRVGAGGMGVVYAAYDPELDRKVALKVLATSTGSAASSDTRSGSRLREAQALARLSHPNVVAVYDVGTFEGRVWLAMEFVAGRTFAEWMRAEPRSWREVLDVLRPIAVGLAAAHASGLVHRDVKPDNVMLAADVDGGRARLMDFGLARAAASTDVPTEGSDAVETPHVPRASARAGTPGYMAPEQWLGLPADPRTDQFSFCVMLWESLFTQRAFAGETPAELAASVLAGNLRPVARDQAAPGWLRRAVRRGLERDPAARHSSMLALLEAIDRGRGRARRRTALAVLGAALVLGVAALGIRAAARASRVAACEAEGAAIAEVWNPEVRDGLHEALAAAPVAYATATADKVMPWFEAHAETWRRTTTAACLATEVEATAKPELLDRARWCLEARRMELQAVLEQLGRGGAKATERAVNMAASMPRIEPCGDPEVLARMPAIPEARDRVHAIRRELQRAAAMASAGDHASALTLSKEVEVQARDVGWPPLVAAAQARMGHELDASGKFAEAEAKLSEAYFTAAAADDPGLAADVADALAFAVGVRLERFAEGLTWSRHAELARTRLVDPGGVDEARHLATLGNIRSASGALAEAQALHERSLEIRERVLGPEHPETAGGLNNLANALFRSGELERAGQLYQRACDVMEASLGPEHPTVATCLVNLASIVNATGSPERAGPLYDRALAVLEGSLGATHPSVASVLVNRAHLKVRAKELDPAAAMYSRALAIWEGSLGDVHPLLTHPLLGLSEIARQQGRTADAVALAERALALLPDDKSQPDLAAAARFGLAQSLWMADGGLHARALAEQARAYHVERGAAGAQSLAEVDAWLATHPASVTGARGAADVARSP